MLIAEIAASALEAVLLAALAGLIWRTLRGPPVAEPGRRRRLAGDVLLRLVTVVFFVSGITKLMHLPFAVQEMSILHLSGWKYDLTAAVEITSGVLVSIFRLRSLALLWICAHCGGAVSAHLIAGQDLAAIPTLVVLTTTCLGAFLRHPQMLWSLTDAGARRQVTLNADGVAATRA